MKNVLHLAGPGGAGKTSVGKLLGKLLAWEFIDLDESFISSAGDISAFIETKGYRAYAQRNLAIYESIVSIGNAPVVLALSSGFITYPADVAEGYLGLRHRIEHNPLSVLLLPSFELEECVEIIVSRQMGRHYLNGNSHREEEKIRQRFPAFMSFECTRFLSNVPVTELACRIMWFARERKPAF